MRCYNAAMKKYDGLSTEELTAKGFTVQTDGRLRLHRNWKSQCKNCRKWFGRVSGDECWLCYGRATIEHRRKWKKIRTEKRWID